MDDWQKEFPNLYNLKHNPKTFVADVFCGSEKKLRQLILFVTLILMGYVIYQTLVIYYGANVTDVRDLSREQLGQVLGTWKVWRNILFGLLTADFVLVIISSVISVVKKQYAKLIKTVYSFAVLTMFLVPFSYPLAMVITSVITYVTKSPTVTP